MKAIQREGEIGKLSTGKGFKAMTQPTPSPLTREQVESICADIESMIDSDGVAVSDFLKHDAALRLTLAQQAQEIERLKQELLMCQQDV